MLVYPSIDPVAINLGFTQIYWYGIMYVLGFVWVYFYLLGKSKSNKWTKEEVTDVIFYSAFGVVFGGTIGDILLYDIEVLFNSPLELLKFWRPGRSFHGGLVGVIIAIYVFCKVYKKKYFEVTDFIAPSVPFALFFGRIGNFINAELWGRISNVPWAIAFPHDNIPRHPSQLYEALLEGILLGVILLHLSKKIRPQGFLSAVFLLGYGIARFIAEFFREPDISQGFMVSFLTMGHLLSIIMMMVGIFLLIKVFTKKVRK